MRNVKRNLILLICLFSLFSCKQKLTEAPKPPVPSTDNGSNFLYIKGEISKPGLNLRGLSTDESEAAIQKAIVKDIKSVDMLFFAADKQTGKYYFKEIKSFPVDQNASSLKSVAIKSYTETEKGLTIEFTPVQLDQTDYQLLLVFNLWDRIKTRLTNKVELAEFKKSLFIENDSAEPRYNLENMFIPDKGAILLSSKNFSNSKLGAPQKAVSFNMISAKAYFTVQYTGRLENETHSVSSTYDVYPDVVNKQFAFYADPIHPSVVKDKQVDLLWAPPTYTPTYLSNGGIKAQTENFVYVTDYTIFKSFAPITYRVGATDLPYGQISENTHQGPLFSGYYVSRLILRLQYAPEGMNVGDSWARFGGRVLSLKEFKALVDKIKDEKSVLTDFEKRFKDAYSEAEKVQSTNFFYKRLVTSGLKYENSFSYAGIDYYHQGYCFYAIPILHKMVESSKGSGDALPLYGIVRNHLYKIKINTISSVGVPTVYGLSRTVEYDKIGYSSQGSNTSFPEIIKIDVDL